MNRLNFKVRILIYIAIAAIVPFIISWFSIYHIVDRKLQKDLTDVKQNYVQNQVTKIDELLKQQETILESIANSFMYLTNDEKSINSFLKQQIKINNGFNNIYIIKNDGTVYGGNVEKLPEKDLTLTLPYITARKAQKLIWLEPYTDTLSNQRSIGIAMPITDMSDNEVGVLIGNISVEAFADMLANAKYMPDVEIILFNSYGYVKYDSDNRFSESVNITDSDFILQPVCLDILNLSEGKHQFNFKDNNWTCFFSSIAINGWKVVALTDTDKFVSEVVSINKGIYNYIILFGILAILIVGIIATILSNSISKPLLKLRDGAKALAVGELDIKIVIPGNDELNDLANSFNEMSASLKKSYEELFNRTDELYKNNQYLQEINSELEASYQQLGATMLQLNESEEKYRKLMSNISDMVFVINTDNIIIYINPKLERVLGYNESDLIGKPISIFIKDGNINNPFIEAFVSDYVEYQMEMIQKDGNVIFVEGSAQRILEEDRVTGVQAIARDITLRKHMEDQLAKRYNELQVLNNVSSAIANTLDLDNILYKIVNQVIDVSEALVCSIRLINAENNNVFELKAVEGVMIAENNIDDLRISEELIHRIIRKKESLTIKLEEYGLSSNYIREVYESAEGRYISFNPLIIQGAAIGIMSTITRNLPDDDQIDLLSSLANASAIAIDNARAYENLKKYYIKTVQSLISAVEAKDLYTESHSIRVAKYACFIAAEMGYPKTFLEDIWVAGVLHDIGKIGISDSILNKKDRLTQEEYEIVKQHPMISYKIVSKIGLNHEITDAIKYHHERFDGRGYPEGLTEHKISTMAAIISIADAFDAITSERSYKKAKTIGQGITEIVDNKGTQFNPDIVDVFERVFLMKPETIEKIYNDEEIDFF